MPSRRWRRTIERLNLSPTHMLIFPFSSRDPAFQQTEIETSRRPYERTTVENKGYQPMEPSRRWVAGGGLAWTGPQAQWTRSPEYANALQMTVFCGVRGQLASSKCCQTRVLDVCVVYVVSGKTPVGAAYSRALHVPSDKIWLRLSYFSAARPTSQRPPCA